MFKFVSIDYIFRELELTESQDTYSFRLSPMSCQIFKIKLKCMFPPFK